MRLLWWSVVVAPYPLVCFAAQPCDDAPAPPTDITNGIGLKLKLVKRGKFFMGSPKEEWGRDCDRPRHDAEVASPFYMGVYPVTRGQFAAFVEDVVYQTEAEQDGDVRTWQRPGFGQTDDDPVVCISWNDAGWFCDWLGKKEKKAYRLPTEAEWEYACRAGTTTAYFFGDDPKIVADYAWYGKNSQDRTHPVGGKMPNPWGLYDMAGNVSEWCLDKFPPTRRRATQTVPQGRGKPATHA